MTDDDNHAPSLPVAPWASMPRDTALQEAGGVVVSTQPTVMEAELVRAHLASVDIEAWLADEGMGSVMPHMGMSEGIRVVVAAAHQENAMDALRSVGAELVLTEDAAFDVAGHPNDANAPDDDDLALVTADRQLAKLANRALASAMLGVILWPIGSVYSIWLLGQLAALPSWSLAVRAKAGFAALIDVATLGAAGFFVWQWFN